jgi:hypothetical protein
MKSSGMKKKTSATRKKKDSPSRTALKSSKTKTQSSKNKNAKAKRDSNSQEPQKTPLSQSFLPGGKKQDASSPHGQPLAKKEEPTWEDDNWEEEGWSKPRRVTKDEHRELKRVFDKNGVPRIRSVGRHKKPIEEKLNSKPFRISLQLELAFKLRAKENGFNSWQEWLRVLGAREVGIIESAT